MTIVLVIEAAFARAQTPPGDRMIPLTAFAASTAVTSAADPNRHIRSDARDDHGRDHA
jgi:hypothetical protein